MYYIIYIMYILYYDILCIIYIFKIFQKIFKISLSIMLGQEVSKSVGPLLGPGLDSHVSV